MKKKIPRALLLGSAQYPGPSESRKSKFRYLRSWIRGSPIFHRWTLRPRYTRSGSLPLPSSRISGDPKTSCSEKRPQTHSSMSTWGLDTCPDQEGTEQFLTKRQSSAYLKGMECRAHRWLDSQERERILGGEQGAGLTTASKPQHPSLESESESRSVVPDSLRPHELYSPWNSPGQNTGVGNLSLLQGIFPTQGLNPGLPHCRRILYQLSHKGSPLKTPI